MAVSANSQFSPSVQTFSLANGNTAELMLAGNPARQSLLIQPQTEASLVNFGATAGTQATGTLTFGANPAAAVTIAVLGVTFTFIAGASTATDVHLGADKEETAVNFVAVLNASVTGNVPLATYAISEADPAVVTVTADAGGTDGNALTLADSSGAGAVTRSGATLTGGSTTVGGIALAAGQIAQLDASQYPSIRNDVFIVSATTAAYTNYLEGLS